MSIANGFIQMNRYAITDTYTTLSVDGYVDAHGDGYVNCGDPMQFTISIFKVGGIDPALGGYVHLVRSSDGYVYATRHIPEGVVNIPGISFYDGYNIIYAAYDGYDSGHDGYRYRASRSADKVFYVVKLNTDTTINAATSHTFNHTSSYSVTVNVISDSILDINGTVKIRFYSTNAIFISGGTFPVVSGTANCTIPGNTVPA